MMSGWKTWMAAIGSVLWGVGGFLAGQHDADALMQFVVAGLGLVGIGHKIERAGEK